jgi:regulator of protease activity HflC (stomatin/prohibitin superfamily)
MVKQYSDNETNTGKSAFAWLFGRGKPFNAPVFFVVIVVILVAVMIILSATLVRVDAGYKGVVVSGFNIGHQFEEGWHFKNPMDGVDYVRYNTQEISFIGQDYAEDSQGSIMAITEDNVEIYIDMTVVFSIPANRVSALRINNGADWKDVVVSPIVRSIPRDVAADFSVYEIAGTQRAALSVNIETELRTAFATKDIILERFALRDIRLPDVIIQAVEEKKAAEQKILTEGYNLEAEKFRAQQAVVNAEAQYNVTIIEARARQEAIQIVMERFNTTDGSSNESDMVNNYLQWLYIQALTDPDSNIQYILLPSENGMPILLDLTGAEP